ncbi:hypothetical protein ACE5IS_19430 [Leptospira wolffii]|uniref:Uncharacterized protein n=1 Tax=Leptospira wolffii TaxID=409998 RepID=A0ABV5BU97_9LEPT
MFNKKRIEQLMEMLRGLGTTKMKEKRRRREYIQKLQNNEITAIKFAEEVPIIIYKLSDKRFVKKAIECHRFNFGEHSLQEALGDDREIIEIYRLFALNKLCELKGDFEAMQGMKSNDKAFKRLLDRTTYALAQEYPWLSDNMEDVFYE